MTFWMLRFHFSQPVFKHEYTLSSKTPASGMVSSGAVAGGICLGSCQLVIRLSSHSSWPIPCQPNCPPAGLYTSIKNALKKGFFLCDCIVSPPPILIWWGWRSSLTVSSAVILRLIQRSCCRQKSMVLVDLLCWTWMNITPVSFNFDLTKKCLCWGLPVFKLYIEPPPVLLRLLSTPQQILCFEFLFDDKMSNALAWFNININHVKYALLIHI